MNTPAIMNLHSIFIALVFGVCLTAPHVGASDGPKLTESAAMKNADSVVVGRFTGRVAQIERQITGSFDETGAPTTRKIKLASYEFAVSELLSGKPTERIVAIAIPGIQEIPAAGMRVVVGLAQDGQEYNSLYSKYLPANTDADLERVRGQVAAWRTPEPESLHSIQEQEAAEARHIASPAAASDVAMSVVEPKAVQRMGPRLPPIDAQPLSVGVNGEPRIEAAPGKNPVELKRHSSESNSIIPQLTDDSEGSLEVESSTRASTKHAPSSHWGYVALMTGGCIAVLAIGLWSVGQRRASKSGSR